MLSQAPGGAAVPSGQRLEACWALLLLLLIYDYVEGGIFFAENAGNWKKRNDNEMILFLSFRHKTSQTDLKCVSNHV